MEIGRQIQRAQILEGREAVNQWEKDLHRAIQVTSWISDPQSERDCGKKCLFKSAKQLEKERNNFLRVLGTQCHS